MKISTSFQVYWIFKVQFCCYFQYLCRGQKHYDIAVHFFTSPHPSQALVDCTPHRPPAPNCLSDIAWLSLSTMSICLSHADLYCLHDCMTCVLLCLPSAVSLSHFLRLATTRCYYIFLSSNLSLNSFTPIIFWKTCLIYPVLHCFFCYLHSWILLFFRITLLVWLINRHLVVRNMRFLLIHYFISFQQQSWLSISLIKSPTLIKCFCDKSSFFVLQYEICISILYILQLFYFLGILEAMGVFQGSKWQRY